LIIFVAQTTVTFKSRMSVFRNYCYREELSNIPVQFTIAIPLVIFKLLFRASVYSVPVINVSSYWIHT